ncbi:MAG: hypothetical protein RBR47_06265 [Bacteroidales bacterium]|jgi:hypothetical protein|nr:hypothetical protein [Bacteroidales bacterium]MDD2631065.1 hypothetical protein [Bacteroidales bacterium]MDD4741613.1 hypothetical protein [Bacteroidales bacterium]MDY0334545.1 hypothetical protein [Bacteroidales bacterium]
MKTKIITTIFILIASSGFAQSDSLTPKFRPTEGNLALELDFLPFSESGPIDLKSFQVRYFISPQLVLRAGFNFDRVKKDDELPRTFQHNGNSIMKFNKYEMDYTLWGINAGLAYHFFDNTRVSPYLGIDIGYEAKAAKYNDEVNSYNSGYPSGEFVVAKTEIENGWGINEVIYDPWGNPVNAFTVHQRAYSSIKANLVAGTDIYIMKHFYAGVELGLGMETIKYKEVTMKKDGVLKLKFPEKKDNTFGLNFNNAIRIGFWF